MALLQFMGFLLFIIASFVIGGRLLALWRRTRELPELLIGIAFLVGGGGGYTVWLVRTAAIHSGATPELTHQLAFLGLVATCAGSLAQGVGTYRIYRPDQKWPLLLIGGVAMFMATFAVRLVRVDPAGSAFDFWLAMSSCMVFYVWGAVESLVLARTLHRRAKLEMADPIVVNRALQWSIAGWIVVAMMAISILSSFVNGAEIPASWAASLSCLGVVCAVAIWIGFFPNESVRRYVARVYAS